MVEMVERAASALEMSESKFVDACVLEAIEAIVEREKARRLAKLNDLGRSLKDRKSKK